MGSYAFETYHDGTDVKQAFAAAREQAQYDHGHAGYTGTIAEKHNYAVVQKTPVTVADARRIADDLMDKDDPRISDKWGPAGAIPVVTETRTVAVSGFDYTPTKGIPYYAPDPALLEIVTDLLRKKRGLRRGEEVVAVNLQSYVQAEPRHSGYGYGYGPMQTAVIKKQCTAIVTVKKAPSALKDVASQQPDGWLFFGWASS